MDVFPFDTSDADVVAVLPYDDPQTSSSTLLTSLAPSDSGHRSLADRIGTSKIYLLSDASKSHSGKRRRDQEEESEDASDDVNMDHRESPYRDNAILFHGTPISNLPTSNIFAYATHFDAHPLGLEWVDDKTCVVVFESKADARSAFRVLQKSLAEEPSLDDGTVTAKPIPMAIWPSKDRIDVTLGKGDGLKGILRMRWARVEDVKKKRARDESEFYKKYGRDAGKTFEEGPSTAKRRRHEDRSYEAAEKAKLDDELDSFLAEDDVPQSPPSKMRSDYIGKDGRTLLQRTSGIRVHPDSLSSRITAPLPRRARLQRGEDDRPWNERQKREKHERLAEPGSRGGRNNRESPRERKPRVTQEDLDAELDAFLNAKD